VALDEDVGNNARVSYKIDEQQLKSVIDVYPTTGVVYLKYPLDRESQDNYVIKVVATDHGVPPLSSTTTIHITVTDENDNSPKFEQVRLSCVQKGLASLIIKHKYVSCYLRKYSDSSSTKTTSRIQSLEG